MRYEIPKDRFEITDSSLGTYWYKLTVSESERDTIIRNQEIVQELTKLVKDMDTNGTVNKNWVRMVLERILLYGLRAK